MRIILILMLYSFFSIAQQNKEQLAYQYFINQEYNKAIILYKELNQKSFSIKYYKPYFSSLINTEKFITAEKLARKAFKIFPKNLEYEIEIGITYYKRGNSRKAEKIFKKVFSKLKNSKYEIKKIANTFNSYQMYEQSLSLYSHSGKLNPTTNFNLEKAQLYANLEKPELMINEYFNELLQNPNQKSKIIYQVQKFLDNNGIKSEKNYELVKKILLKYVKKEKQRTEFSELLIWFFMQNHQFEMALQQAKALDKRTYGTGEKVFTIAESLLENEHYILAIKAYNFLIEKGDKNHLFIQSNINKLYAETKILEQKKESLNKINTSYKETISKLGTNKNTVRLLLNYAHFKAFYLHELNEAKKILQNTTTISGISKTDLAECKLEYADIELLLGNIWESLLYYSQVEKSFKESPLGHEAKLRRAKIAYYQGDFQWAQAQLDILKASTSKLIANDAMQLSLMITDNYNLDTSECAMKLFANAELLTYQKKYNEAIEKFDSILTTFKGHSLSDEIYLRKADIYIKKEKIQMALNMYQQIIDEWPYDILTDEALYRQAKVYELFLNNKQEAIRIYKQILLEYTGSIYTIEARKIIRELQKEKIQ